MKAPSIYWRNKITVLKVFLRTQWFWSYKVNILIIADNLTYSALIVKHRWFYQLLTVYLVSQLYKYITNYILVLTYWVILFREYINCSVTLLCNNLVYNNLVYVAYIYIYFTRELLIKIRTWKRHKLNNILPSSYIGSSTITEAQSGEQVLLKSDWFTYYEKHFAEYYENLRTGSWSRCWYGTGASGSQSEVCESSRSVKDSSQVRLADWWTILMSARDPGRHFCMVMHCPVSFTHSFPLFTL